MLSKFSCPILHHIGFMDPPFPINCLPQSDNYKMIASSMAVANNLKRHGFPVPQSAVVYPGARTDLFGDREQLMSSSLRFAYRLCSKGINLASHSNPLKIGFAGLLMGSKGLHTLIEALTILRNKGLCIQAVFAGAEFEPGYKERLESYLVRENMNYSVQFVGQLSRSKLRRFWDLHHIGVFSSIYPEAFGIVAAEIMASGVALVSSGVGGAAELVLALTLDVYSKPEIQIILPKSW